MVPTWRDVILEWIGGNGTIMVTEPIHGHVLWSNSDNYSSGNEVYPHPLLKQKTCTYSHLCIVGWMGVREAAWAFIAKKWSSAETMQASSLQSTAYNIRCNTIHLTAFIALSHSAFQFMKILARNRLIENIGYSLWLFTTHIQVTRAPAHTQQQEHKANLKFMLHACIVFIWIFCAPLFKQSPWKMPSHTSIGLWHNIVQNIFCEQPLVIGARLVLLAALIFSRVEK